MIRQNPTNPCIIESSVNGTDWCPFIDLSLCTNFGTQPGSSTPPAPGGGTQETCGVLQANGIMLIPALVNSGDTILLESANGAGWDGGEFDFGPLWRKPSGNQYIGGLEYPNCVSVGTDPLPSACHMKIIAGIGDTPDYLELTVGTPVAVPAGIAAAQLWLQVNDDPIGNNAGNYDICVLVTNNQTATDVNITYPIAGDGPSSIAYNTNFTVDSTVFFNGSFNENLMYISFDRPVSVEVISVTGWIAFTNTGDFLGIYYIPDGTPTAFHVPQSFDPATSYPLIPLITVGATSSAAWSMTLQVHPV